MKFHEADLLRESKYVSFVEAHHCGESAGEVDVGALDLVCEVANGRDVLAKPLVCRLWVGQSVDGVPD